MKLCGLALSLVLAERSVQEQIFMVRHAFSWGVQLLLND